MTEFIQKKLSDSKAARWTALAIVAFTMLCGYFLTDVMSPLKPMLEAELAWTSTDFGFFTSAYGWFNVFFLMLIFGGMILDKMGVRFTGMMSCILMLVGCAIKYAAIAGYIGASGEILGFKAQVAYASLGYAIFGMGVEIAGITVSKVIVKWFKGKELALAMGLEMATARIGTMLAMAITVPFAKYFQSVSAPVLLCLIMLCIGTISYMVYVVMDKKLEASMAGEEEEKEEPFRFSDVFLIIRNRGFWLIALLCVLFYSAVFPFIKYATDLMVNKYGVEQELAGFIPSLLPLGTLFLTPFFGNLYDRHGKGASIMLLGAVALVLGLVGIFVPLLPTTPFLLLAAALWVRSSPRLYGWLVSHRRLGPYIRQFREYRAIPLRAKVISVALLWATLLYCIVAVVDRLWWAQLLLLAVAVGVTWHILSFATLRR